MGNWLISVPVWGASYITTFKTIAAPALVAAAKRLKQPAKFLLHTDGDGTALLGTTGGFPTEIRTIANKPTYVALQESHADAVRSAQPGERVVLLNADLVISGNFLKQCAKIFDADQAQAIVLLGIRTAAGIEKPPVDAKPRQLLEWAWLHRHQIIRDLEYPSGSSMLPTNIFWSHGESTVARGFHLHPAAIIKSATTNFHSTIDGDLLDCFPRSSIRVITDPDEAAMCEVSPPDRRFPIRGGRMSIETVVKSMLTRASPMHRWLFEHRIIVRGTGSEITEDHIFAKEVLSRMGRSTFGKKVG